MRKAIAIDFDGCLCEWAWPEIGAPHMDVINKAIREQNNGTAIILWTCRVGRFLEAAVDWCSSYGLEFDAVNANLPERITAYQTDCRKVNADEYWDDRAVHMPQPPNDPLNLEELREMEGEPVYCISDYEMTVNGEKGHQFHAEGWGIVTGTDLLDQGFIVGTAYIYYLEHYGKTWLAYRRKPGEGAR